MYEQFVKKLNDPTNIHLGYSMIKLQNVNVIVNDIFFLFVTGKKL